MRVAADAAVGEGIVAISAGNYDGKLGKFPFNLHELFASEHRVGTACPHSAAIVDPSHKLLDC
jgi:hypothetical protein